MNIVRTIDGKRVEISLDPEELKQAFFEYGSQNREAENELKEDAVIYRHLSEKDEELERICNRNGRSLKIFGDGSYETADLSDGCDWQRFSNYEEALEWESGYIPAFSDDEALTR